MKIRMLFLIMTIALGATKSFAETDASAARPAQVNVGGFEAVRYWIIKKMVLDIDAVLKEQGIESVMCTFRQNQPAKDFSYLGVGPCLVKAFLKSMKTDQSAGAVYTWIKDRQGRFHPVEIQWRPPVGGWSQIIDQVLEMKMEKQLYWIRDHIWGLEEEKVRYSDFILGDLKIILPEDPEALSALAEKGGSWAKNYLSKVKSVSLQLKTTGNEKGKVIFTGDLILTPKSSDEGTSQATTVHLRTNVNVMLLKRPFFLDAKMRTSGTGADVPSTEETLP
ncbi:hypothetical protein [Bdellovibrio svalbardensis]|uniref:Uncharacterized protein n=1 Tax=Bdellovibrio svalbardensis TaxID=2972972 RepID=A0ABT6DK30_9BACT|nr:hypothetical protein [Bdellovibrio svalbardensis]MDG0817222.1 hypothetical protein [Bdellovibrio svalbardensis]